MHYWQCNECGHREPSDEGAMSAYVGRRWKDHCGKPMTVITTNEDDDAR